MLEREEDELPCDVIEEVGEHIELKLTKSKY